MLAPCSVVAGQGGEASTMFRVQCGDAVARNRLVLVPPTPHVSPSVPRVPPNVPQQVHVGGAWPRRWQLCVLHCPPACPLVCPVVPCARGSPLVPPTCPPCVPRVLRGPPPCATVVPSMVPDAYPCAPPRPTLVCPPVPPLWSPSLMGLTFPWCHPVGCGVYSVRWPVMWLRSARPKNEPWACHSGSILWAYRGTRDFSYRPHLWHPCSWQKPRLLTRRSAGQNWAENGANPTIVA